MSFHVNFDSLCTEEEILPSSVNLPLHHCQVKKLCTVLQCPFRFANIKRTTFFLVIHSPQHYCSVIAGMYILKLCMERTKSFFVTQIHTSTIVQQNKVTQCSNVNFYMLLSTWLTPGTKSFDHYQMTWYISIKYKLHAWPHSIQCRAKRRKDMSIRVEHIDFRSFTFIFQLPLNPSQYATQYINVVLCQSMVKLMKRTNSFLVTHLRVIVK